MHVHDPVAAAAEAEHEYGVELVPWEALPRAAAIVGAVAHRAFKARPVDDFVAKLAPGGLFVDVKSQMDAGALRRARRPRLAALIRAALAMTLSHDALQRTVAATRRRWLVTGAAGFIGSHLVETLLELGQEVVGLDNFATGHRRNLDDVRARRRTKTPGAASASSRATSAICRACRRACEGVDIVLHQAALGSVPRSIADPLATHAANATGFLNMLSAAREAGVRRFVYAASSSTYGDHPALPKVEDAIGRPLSPYAVTKHVNELYADVFARCYGVETIGLRYFNVFGARQDPEGAYAAVIPRWIRAMRARRSRDDLRRRRDEPRLLLRRERGAGEPAGRLDDGRRRAEPGLQRRRRRAHDAERTVRGARVRSYATASPG